MSQPNTLPTVKLLIGGELVESTTREWRDIVNPATQEVLARVPFATEAEMNAAVASAKEAFKTWRKTPIGVRSRIFLKYQQLIREHMLELGALANNVAPGVDHCTLLQPLVICARITPFNFPAMIPLWMFPMAIATGNTFVLKRSEQDARVTMRLAELAMEAGVPPGV